MKKDRLPALTVSTEEALGRVSEQIRKGEDIRDRSLAYPEDLEEARKAYNRWNAYNVDMLRRFFDTTVVADEYRQVVFEPPTLSLEPEPFTKKVTDFKQGLDRKVHKLNSIRDRLPLFSVHEVRRIAAGRNEVRKGTLFIVTPDKNEDPDQANVLITMRLAAMERGLQPMLAEKGNSGKPIGPQALDLLTAAEFVVADLTHGRPEVYFQAGFAEAFGNTPIYVAKKGTEVAFDTGEYQVIFFEDNEQLLAELNKRLAGLMEKTKVHVKAGT
jgi:hypothetical protein